VSETRTGSLTIVGTPIGNLSDMSPRALAALAASDFIAAEDTRVTLKLLNHAGIKKPMVSYFEHNKRERGEIICARILEGETCALVTDAGMPCISDPGEDLVILCAERGIPVTVVPGPSAAVTALAVSGLPTGRFCFEGFLSTAKKHRREHLQKIQNEERTMIFYEAPHKLPATLCDLLEALGNRPAAIVRELTKLHEEVVRTTLAEAAERYRKQPVKGEIVLIVGGAPETAEELPPMEQALEIAKQYIKEGHSRSEAARRAAKESGHKKGEIYRGLDEGRRREPIV